MQACVQTVKHVFQKAGIYLSVLSWIFLQQAALHTEVFTTLCFSQSIKKIHYHPRSACCLLTPCRHVSFLYLNYKLKWSEDIDPSTSVRVQYRFHITTVTQTTHSSPFSFPAAALPLPLEGFNSQIINWITQMGKTKVVLLTQGLAVIWAWSLPSLINAN